MKHLVRVTLEYEEEFEVEGSYEDAELKGEERRDQLEETMNVLGTVDSDAVKTLCYVREIKENKDRDRRGLW